MKILNVLWYNQWCSMEGFSEKLNNFVKTKHSLLDLVHIRLVFILEAMML